MGARAEILPAFVKLARLSTADKLRLLAQIYHELGDGAVRDALRILNLPMSRIDSGKRWSYIEDPGEPVGEWEEYAEEPAEEVEDSYEEVREEYVGYSKIKRILLWK